jgi:hypothetical protein
MFYPAPRTDRWDPWIAAALWILVASAVTLVFFL